MISNQALEKARTAAPGYDVYALKSDYLAFWDDKGGNPSKMRMPLSQGGAKSGANLIHCANSARFPLKLDEHKGARGAHV